MKVNYTKCDICGKQFDDEDNIYKYSGPGGVVEIKPPNMFREKTKKVKLDICIYCWTNLCTTINNKTDKWKVESEQKPRLDEEVLITDGIHYGTGKYVFDCNRGHGWKVSAFDKISSVTYWKKMEELPISQKKESEV